MKIHINGETERLIQAALGSGDFASAEEFIAALASKWQSRETINKPPQNAFDAFSKLDVIGCMKSDVFDLSSNPEHMDGFGS